MFLSTGDYHHHIGLNTWDIKEADTLPENSAGLEYYTLNFPDQNMRNKSAEKLKKMSYKIIEKDNEIFIEDPAGNVIKLLI